MKKWFSNETDGFYGVLNSNENKKIVIILYVDDDPKSMIGKGATKWFVKENINVLSMSPGKKNAGVRRNSIDRIENAVKYLKEEGYERIGIMGLSITAMISLAAASLIPDITLTIAATPCDFIMEGTIEEKLDGTKERPAGESTLTWRGKELPYLPYAYRHPKYWNQVVADGKRRGDIIAAIDMFDESEKLHPIQEDEFIKVENIKGHLVLIGSKDDVMWNTVRYIERMEYRLKSHPHTCTYETMIFDHGTHYVFPEGAIKKLLPFGVDLILPKLFSEAKGYTDECRKTRVAIEKRILELVKSEE